MPTKLKEIQKEIEYVDTDLEDINVDLSILESRKNSLMGIYIALLIAYLYLRDTTLGTTVIVVFFLFIAYYLYEWFRFEIRVCRINKLFKRKKELITEKYKKK